LRAHACACVCVRVCAGACTYAGMRAALNCLREEGVCVDAKVNNVFEKQYKNEFFLFFIVI
jgi:hypothetical protein